MKKNICFFYSILLVLLFYSCNGNRSKNTQAIDSVSIDYADFSYPVQFKYAKGIEVKNHDHYKEVMVFSPDTPDTMATYILYPRGEKRPQLSCRNCYFIPVPLKNIACLSTTQVGVLPLLGKVDKLVGCSNIKNICNPEVRKRISEGKVQEIARGMAKNIEQIAALHPEVVLQDLSRMSDKDEELISSGINTVLYNEWKERNLLGRAEWMKLTAMLLGCNAKADKLFSKIEEDYLKAKELVAQQTDTIPIMYGLDYKGTWYLPGEFSYPTSMFRDAGVKFDYAEGKVSSQPCSFERIFSRHRHAKIWICMMTGKIFTMADFLALNDRYKHFDAAANGMVFIDRKRVNENGGNDFWESGLYRPDLLLKDIIKITRPQLLPDYETTYWMQLKK
ncbi:ABC transporter substrate-binding protein [Porphyromonas pogonae]|uniref:ABC transporter substrate-binding protein n=1 Tax=Porphyromonas pogonae TaxID=867595 RepID=UPI002E764F40|nr:ABC transporter substrate-binding protein [Porphyromonas pogonae]